MPPPLPLSRSDSYADEQKALGNSQDVQLGQEIQECVAWQACLEQRSVWRLCGCLCGNCTLQGPQRVLCPLGALLCGRYLLTTIEGLPIIGKCFKKGRTNTLKLVQKVQYGGMESIRAVRAHSAKAARWVATTTSSGNEMSDTDKGDEGGDDDGDTESKPGAGAGAEANGGGDVTPTPRGSAMGLVQGDNGAAGKGSGAAPDGVGGMRPPGSVSPDLSVQVRVNVTLPPLWGATV